MKHARVKCQGVIFDATGEHGGVRLSDGRWFAEEEVEWLPPLEFGTIFLLALNYADHAKEVAVQSAADPVVFLKGPESLTGHRTRTPRPREVAYMHYECELAVVIGKQCERVPRARAYDVVSGYTVANDYAIRDYLENYYRPNLRVKSRDRCTPVGPFFVDAADVPDPMNLRIRSWVNGVQTQDGTTRDMIFDIPALIEYLSATMTLNPGDVILTGTPQGVSNAAVGDEIVTEVEGVGRLVNYIESE
jgi:5-oxopent-3-ene-1,2,5-tricarboxylate decarboxylase/2-hydroxyhepta-2,4-diene-1,7-dioate isomerase